MEEKEVKLNDKRRKNDIKDNQKENRKNKGIVLFFILIILIAFVYYELFSIVSYTLGKKEKQDVLIYKVINIINNKFYPEKIKIKEDNSLNILSLGDIAVDKKINNKYNFDSSFKYTKDFLGKFDVVTASLNTKLDDNILSLIKNLNISLLSISNKKVNDLNFEELKNNNLNYIGLKDEKPYIIEKNNIKVGVISYISLDESENLKLVLEENIDKDLEYLNENNVDCIIAYLNMPNEKSSRISAKQKEEVNKLLNKGINIVLCTGPKNINEIDEDVFEENGKSRHTFVAYSMGEFVGDLNEQENRYSLALNIEIDKNVVKDGRGNIVESKTNVNIKKPIEIYNKIDKNFSFINYPINYMFKNVKDMSEDLTKELTNVEENINEILYK